MRLAHSSSAAQVPSIAALAALVVGLGGLYCRAMLGRDVTSERQRLSSFFKPFVSSLHPNHPTSTQQRLCPHCQLLAPDLGVVADIHRESRMTQEMFDPDQLRMLQCHRSQLSFNLMEMLVRQ